MKIALVHNLPPGGQKRVLYYQTKLLSNNHYIDLYTLSSTNESYLSLAPFIKKHSRIAYNQPAYFPQSVFSIYRELKHAYKNMAEQINLGKYEVCLVHPDFLTQAPYILQFLKIPSLYWCPEPKREFYEPIPRISHKLSYSLTYPLRYPIKYIDQHNTKAAAKILTNSLFSKKKIDAVYHVKSHVNYPGVDTQVFKRRALKREQIVLTVGTLSLFKGHDFIIESLSQIEPIIRPEFVIIGRGEEDSEYLLSLAKKLRVNLKIKKNVTDEELVTYYSKAKVFVYAAYQEPFGLVLLEAAACGLPIVAVNEGGVGEILKTNDLGIKTARDAYQFAMEIEKVLKGQVLFDEKLMKHTFEKKWKWNKSVEELERHIYSLKGSTL